MKRQRPRLRLVGPDPGAGVFDDLAKLRQDDLANVPLRRQRLTETFARVPHDKALELGRKIDGAAWVILIELDRIILKHHGQNPVKLISGRLRAAGINKRTRSVALRQLEAAGVIRVERRKHGLAPRVTHLWFPSLE
jgi:hypothetical protein